MKKVTLRVPVRADGTFDLDAQQDLAKSFNAVQDAVSATAEKLEAIKDLKPRADIPSDATDLGPMPGRIEGTTKRRTKRVRADEQDAQIAELRLTHIAAEPKSVVRGTALATKMQQWLS